MKKYLLLVISFFFIYNTYTQCNAVTTGVPSTNGRVYSTLPTCNASITNMQAPPTGYLQMTNLETGGVYTVTRTGGPVNNFLTARSAPVGGTLFNSGFSALTFQVTTGTTANIVVNNGSTCGGTWNNNSAILSYQRRRPNTPNTPSVVYNCVTNQTTLSSGGAAISGITPNYQWQGSNDNSTWTPITGASGLTYIIGTATTPQYNFYRLRASYGACDAFSASASVIPQGNFTGNIVLTQSATIGGVFNINGNFTLNSGVTITVPQGCELFIEANNVTINGDINATGSGGAGGSAGGLGLHYQVKIVDLIIMQQQQEV